MDDAPAASPLQSVVAVFTAPAHAVSLILRRPDVLAALVITVAVTMLAGFLAAPTALDAMLEQVNESASFGPDERATVTDWISSNPHVAAFLLAGAETSNLLVIVLVWSALLHAGVTMTFAERPEGFAFRHTLSLALHANLVNVLHLVVMKVALVTTGTVPSISVAGLVGLEPSSALGTGLAWIAPFNIWWLALLGLGVSCFFRVPFSRALWIPVVISLGLRTLEIAFVALTGAVGPT